MKRISMVHKMSDALYQFFPDMELDKRNLIADVMLTEAEKYGMLPPKDEDKSFKMRQDGSLTYEVNEWEEE